MEPGLMVMPELAPKRAPVSVDVLEPVKVVKGFAMTVVFFVIGVD
jgi:hypothetical protein